METNIEETTPQEPIQETEGKAKRERAKLFAVIIDSNSGFDCVIAVDNEKELQKQIDKLCLEHEKDETSFSIASIIKGHEVKYKESKSVRLLK